jgi:hypothetical protein
LREQQERRYKTPIPLKYHGKLFEFEISEAEIFFEQQKKNNLNLNEIMIKGFDHFLDSLDFYLDLLGETSAEDIRIKIFGGVTLNNGAILRATNEFHNRPWFSNIAIAMDNEELFEYTSDDGTCYAQVNISRM